MGFLTLPDSIEDISGGDWGYFAPYFEELLTYEIPVGEHRVWLEQWSQLLRVIHETASMVYIRKSLDTGNEAYEKAFLEMVSNLFPKMEEADQRLKERLLGLAVEDSDMRLVIRDLQNEADLFREQNIPLQTELQKLSNEYSKATGGLSVEWEGETYNLSQMNPLLESKDDQIRRDAWKGVMGAWGSVRDQLNKLYRQMLQLRHQIAENAGLDNYRTYAFREKGRFSYTPEDCFTFHQAIEDIVVPAAQRILERRATELGREQGLKPWDWVPEKSLLVGSPVQKELKPYEGQTELVEKSHNIFMKVDETLGGYFKEMMDADLLDLDTRAGKALGGYCSTLSLRKRPFIFMNGVGVAGDVKTMLHEAGHAFHVFETEKLPLIWQDHAPMEFCEVASMAMELLASPYLTEEDGGFYTNEEAAEARIKHLEKIILFWPYMAVVDAFQHWVYTNHTAALDAAACDEKWNELCDRFLPGIEWAGYNDIRVSGWHRKPHIFGSPFYYIEYGMAQVGALQVWRNSLADQAGAIESYRSALAFGGTKTLPELFEAAGAEFRFDTAMMAELVELIERVITELS